MGMEPNPYEAPNEDGYERPVADRPSFRRQKPWWGYVAATVTGMGCIGMLLAYPLAPLDDSGGLQLLVGGFLGLVIYRLMF